MYLPWMSIPVITKLIANSSLEGLFHPVLSKVEKRKQAKLILACTSPANSVFAMKQFKCHVYLMHSKPSTNINWLSIFFNMATLFSKYARAKHLQQLCCCMRWLQQNMSFLYRLCIVDDMYSMIGIWLHTFFYKN